MKERIEEITLALGWVGNIKKEFQKEQTKLRGCGITVSFKPVWQSINQTEFLLKNRLKTLKAKKKV